jgi:hypothetical protein
MLKRFLLLTICAVTVLSGAVFAQGNSQGKGHGKHAQDQDEGRGVQIIFTAHDRDVIRDYYHGNSSNLPPGLAKRHGNLPPGLQKHLERDGTLPPGLQKRVQPFPDDLEVRLPRLPPVYRRVVLGADIIILDRRTQKIMDIVHDILTL